MNKLSPKCFPRAAIAAASALIVVAASGAAHASSASDKELVKKAMTELFIKRDVSAVQRYWGTSYVQHNPGIGNGREDLPAIIKSLPENFKYEPGMVVADGPFVMIHGRYTGWGPKPLIAVDVFRVEGGKLVEHWDVMQEEVPASQTKSGNAMFKPGE